METPGNAAVMRRYFAAWAAGDADAAMALWADDVLHHVPGRGPLSGDFAGKRAFLEAYAAVFAALDGRIEVVAVRDTFIGEERAVALVRECAVRGERRLEFDRVVVYRASGGEIVETWSHDYDLYALDAFWS